jgi:SAM-dependent methyltransferase
MTDNSRVVIASRLAPARSVLLRSPVTGPAASRRRSPFPDYRFAPNIGGHPGSYEIENRAVDQAGHVLSAMRSLAPWAGRTIVDLGCGTGFWLPRYAGAARVIGIEPDPSLRKAAAARVTGIEPDPSLRKAAAARAASAASPRRPSGQPGAEVLAGSAEHIPLPDGTADVVHARFAYFFPPGADAGLAEVLRVLRPGGHLVVVDNDYRWGEFAALLAASASRPPLRTAAEVDKWWRDRTARRHEVRSELRFSSRAELAAVLRIEFPAAVAGDWLRRNPAAFGLTYGFVLFAVAR